MVSRWAGLDPSWWWSRHRQLQVGRRGIDFLTAGLLCACLGSGIVPGFETGGWDWQPRRGAV